MKRKKKGVEFKINTNANYSKWTCTSKDFYDARYFFVKTVFQYTSVFILTSPKLIFVLPTYKTDYYQIVLRISLEIKEKSTVLISSFCCLFVCLSLRSRRFGLPRNAVYRGENFARRAEDTHEKQGSVDSNKRNVL